MRADILGYHYKAWSFEISGSLRSWDIVKCHLDYNATSYETNLSKEWLQWYDWDGLPYSLYHPVLMPSDCHPFVLFRWYLSKKWLHTDYTTVAAKVQDWPKSLDTTFFAEHIYVFMLWLDVCINFDGDTME